MSAQLLFQQTSGGLHEAFKKFSEASERLEIKYSSLVNEAEMLRAQLKAKDAEIQRGERLSMLGQTAAAIAHEVRNPLGAMRILTGLLERELSDRPDSHELVLQINQGILSIDRVVTNILHFSRDGELPHAPVNVHALIEELVRTFRCANGTALTAKLSLAGNPFVVGNEQGLRQVFINLFTNALQATCWEGEVAVSTEDCGNNLSITISDNGPGIPETIADKLFEPFVTTRNEGTGLGLAIVKKIIQQHEGTISVRNENGAVFEIQIPRKRA